VCGSCYQRALAAKDTCLQCGQTRRLMRYQGYEEPVCRECAGAPAHNLCGRCGAEDAPYARGLCARCVLHDRLTELLGEKPQRARVGLDGLFDELAAARSAKDILKWLGRSTAVPLLGRIARGELPCTHETLDRHASDPAVRRLEHLLVASGALPTRDPVLARLERWTTEELAQRLLHDPELSARDRLASVLIAVLAQPVSRVARLTAEDVTVDGENVAIRFGDTAVSMPEPVARDVCKLLAEPAKLSPRVVRHHQWLFPAAAPSRLIGELVLSRRMKRIGVDCNDARRAALLELAGRLPAAIVADLLGVHVATATQWAQIAGRPWGDYPALRAQGTTRG
jgi:hypothetical protein